MRTLLYTLLLAPSFAFSQQVTVTNLIVTGSISNTPTLGQRIGALSLLATNSAQTWSYNPNISGLGTNSSVWTWPINLSCVGYASDGYQATLIAPNELLVCAHYGGESGQSVLFHDTNGVAWTGYVSNVVNVIADMDIAQLSNSAPASIVIPWILPPNYTNYFFSNSIVRAPAFWLHRNTSKIEFEMVTGVSDYDSGHGYGTWMTVAHTDTGPFGGGTSATGGDSGSPAFCDFNSLPVLLFATTSGGDAFGMFVSGATNFNSLVFAIGTNGLNILNLQNSCELFHL